MGDEVKNGAGRFEPPPWEREAFEALARKRAEEQAAQEALQAVALATMPAAEVIEPEAEAVAEKPAPEQPKAEKTEAQALDERQVQAMLMELGREETANSGSIKLIAQIASLITAVVGLGMLVGGVLTIRSAGGSAAGVMGSGALSVFGLCFVAMAVWVWVGSNRVKGSR